MKTPESMPKEVKMHYITVMDKMIRKIMGIENAAHASNM